MIRIIYNVTKILEVTENIDLNLENNASPSLPIMTADRFPFESSEILTNLVCSSFFDCFRSTKYRFKPLVLTRHEDSSEQ